MQVSSWWRANAHRLSATTSQLSTSRGDCTVSHVGSRTFFIRTNNCTSFTVHPYCLPTLLKRMNIYKKKSPAVCGVFIPNLTCWAEGLDTGKVSLYLFVFLSFFLFSLSELRSGSTWVCSIVPQENCQSGLYSEQWKQEFYKEADLLFITSHSQLFLLPNSSFFVALAHIATLQLPFLDFSQDLFILCSFFPSLL